MGCGTGAVAERAARAGADVTGLDLAPVLVETARRCAEEARLSIRYDVGDVEALPYEDAPFHVVVSAIGAIFAPDHERAAAELARVRRGGCMGLTAWEREGGANGLFSVMQPFLPPPPPSPFEWGRPEHVRRLLGNSFELEFEKLDSPLEAGSGEEIWELFSTAFGPVKTLADSRARAAGGVPAGGHRSAHRGQGRPGEPAADLLPRPGRQALTQPTSLEDEVTGLLRELIRIDTATRPGNETRAAELLRDYLEDNGVGCEFLARVPERGTSWRGSRAAKASGSCSSRTRTPFAPTRGRRDGRAAELLARLAPDLAVMVEPMLGMMVSPTMIEASKQRNVIPAVCDVVCDCRLLPGQTQDGAETAIRDRLGADDYELRLLDGVGGSRSLLHTPLWEPIEDFVGESESGASLASVVLSGFTDSHYLRQALGTVAYGFFPLKRMGPELASRLVHSADERIEVDDLELATGVLVDTARRVLA